MIKPLVGVSVVLAGVLGVQGFVGQRNALRKAEERIAGLEAQRAAQPTPVLGFALDQGGDETLATADLCGHEVVLLYLYSNAKRDPALERNLALVAKENPKTVRVVPVRDAASSGPVPEEIGRLGTPATDTKGTIAQGYRVSTTPAVVILKSRPVFHAALTPGSGAQAEQLEPMVDALLARDDLVPVEGGCGGGCGGGGGACMASQMLAAGGPTGCSH